MIYCMLVFPFTFDVLHRIKAHHGTRKTDFILIRQSLINYFLKFHEICTIIDLYDTMDLALENTNVNMTQIFQVINTCYG